MTRNIFLVLLTLAASGCYTLKRQYGAHVPPHHGFLDAKNIGGCPLDPATARAPVHPRPTMTFLDGEYVDSSRQSPNGEGYRYFAADKRGPNGELLEQAVR